MRGLFKASFLIGLLSFSTLSYAKVRCWDTWGPNVWVPFSFLSQPRDTDARQLINSARKSFLNAVSKFSAQDFQDAATLERGYQLPGVQDLVYKGKHYRALISGKMTGLDWKVFMLGSHYKGFEHIAMKIVAQLEAPGENLSTYKTDGQLLSNTFAATYGKDGAYCQGAFDRTD